MPSTRRSFLHALGTAGAALAGGACANRRGPSSVPSAAPPLVNPAGPQPGGIIRIGSNENSHGPGDAALEALRGAIAESNRYAFGAVGETAEAISASLGVRRDHVALGCGSSEILDAAVSAFTSRDNGLVTASPTFELPAARAAAIGVPVSDIRVDGQGRLDLDAMLDAVAGAGLVYLCNPNNPTSTVHGAADVRAFVEQVHRRAVRCTVLVDEAYHEYVDAPAYESAVALATSDPRVVVARTFSKIHGMAGLRIGYAVGQPATLARLRPWLGDMTLSVLTAAAARASLADTAHIDAQRRLNREARAYTLEALARAGCAAFVSEANFVMVDVGRDCRSFAGACAARGVRIARPFPPLTHHARITVGTIDEMRRAAGVFAAVLATPAAPETAWRPARAQDHLREC